MTVLGKIKQPTPWTMPTPVVVVNRSTDPLAPRYNIEYSANGLRSILANIYESNICEEHGTSGQIARHFSRCINERAAILQLAEHIEAMADDAYLQGHPEWDELVNEATTLLAIERKEVST